MQNFVIEPLARAAVLEAWPLVHLTIPQLDLAGWRRNVSAKLGPPGGKPRSGVLVARRLIRRQICGMVWYRCEIDLALGRILRARHLLAIDIIDVVPIMTALLNRLGPIARALNCAAIHLAVHDDGADVFIPTHALLPLRLHSALEHWLDLSFSTDVLCRNDAQPET